MLTWVSQFCLNSYYPSVPVLSIHLGQTETLLIPFDAVVLSVLWLSSLSSFLGSSVTEQFPKQEYVLWNAISVPLPR